MRLHKEPYLTHVNKAHLTHGFLSACAYYKIRKKLYVLKS